MADERPRDETSTPKTEGGRGGDPGKLGGASKPGHLSPQIDERDGTVKKGGQIAQSKQQASGEGGQS